MVTESKGVNHKDDTLRPFEVPSGSPNIAIEKWERLTPQQQFEYMRWLENQLYDLSCQWQELD